LIEFTMNSVSRMVSGTVSGPERDLRLAGDPDVEQLDAEQHEQAGREHLTGELGQRVDPPLVVDDADQADGTAADQHRPDLERTAQPTAQVGQTHRDDHPDCHAAVHRDAAIRGVGMACTSRSRGWVIAPQRTAVRRVMGVSR
jgi:hypothetical protein